LSINKLGDRFEPAVFEGDDMVEAAGEIEIVGRDQGGEAGMADELEEGVQDALAGRVVEIAGRLVAEQDPRVVGERPGDRDALLLAAGEPRRPVPGPRREADTGDQRSGVRSGPPAISTAPPSDRSSNPATCCNVGFARPRDRPA